jgi:hypothetical protein
MVSTAQVWSAGSAYYGMGVVNKEKKTRDGKLTYIKTTRSFRLRRIGTKGKQPKQSNDQVKTSQASFHLEFLVTYRPEGRIDTVTAPLRPRIHQRHTTSCISLHQIRWTFDGHRQICNSLTDHQSNTEPIRTRPHPSQGTTSQLEKTQPTDKGLSVFPEGG